MTPNSLRPNQETMAELTVDNTGSELGTEGDDGYVAAGVMAGGGDGGGAADDGHSRLVAAFTELRLEKFAQSFMDAGVNCLADLTDNLWKDLAEVCDSADMKPLEKSKLRKW